MSRHRDLDFPVQDLLQQMKERSKRKRKCDSFFGFPELFTLAEFAELHKTVNFAVAFSTVTALQHAKSYLLRYGNQEGHDHHPNISLFAVEKEDSEEHLPQCFFLYKQGVNLKIWRPVRVGMQNRPVLHPKSFDERYEFRFIAHMLATTYFSGGLSTDNLLGLLSEDLYPPLESRRRELRKDLELAIVSLALFIDLNDAKSLSKLNLVGGELSFNKTWQRRFSFFKRQLELLRHGSTNIREFQEEARRNLLEKFFPKVFNVRRLRSWLKSYLPFDPRFTREIVNSMTNLMFNEARGFSFEDRTTVEELMRGWFYARSKTAQECPSLFEKPFPPPPVPMRAMWILESADTGHYSRVADYEEAKALVDAYFEARHQKALEYRRQEQLEQEEERRRSSTPPQTDELSDAARSTDSEEDSNIAVAAPEAPQVNNFELEPALEPAPPGINQPAVD